MTNDHRASIERSAGRLARRWLVVEACRTFLRVWFWLLLVAAVAIYLRGGSDAILTLSAATAVALATGVIVANSKRPDAVTLAKAWDDRAGQRDRISSALEIRGEGPMLDLLRREADQAAGAVDAKALLPHRVPREGKWLPVPALLCGLAVFLPTWSAAKAEIDPSFEEAVRDHLSELDDFVAREKAKEPIAKKKDLLAKLERLSAELNRQKADKKDLLAEIGKLADELQKDQEKQLVEKKELEKALKSPKAGDFDKKLDESLQNGDYQDALNKIDQLLDELEKKLKELKDKASPDELKAIEEQIEKLKELKAKLMKLLKMNLDLNAMSEVLDFLDAFEGDLGDIEWLDPRKVKKCDCEGECKCKGTKAALCLNPGNKSRPSLKAGRGTMKEFLGPEASRIDSTREEHKQTIRETSGKSSFTQTKVANDGSKTRLAEKEVFLSESRAAEDAIQRQEIPAGYREYVRKYFEAIQPDDSR